MAKTGRIDWRQLIRYGLLAGVAALYVSVIGMVEVFSQRSLITGVLTLGQLLLFSAPVLAGYLAVYKDDESQTAAFSLLKGVITGLFSSLPLIALVLLANAVNLRAMFVNVSPALIDILVFGQGTAVGVLLLLLSGAIWGTLGVIIHLLPDKTRHVVLVGLSWTLGAGMLSELLIQVFRPLFGSGFIRFVFQGGALKLWASIVVFILVTLLDWYWSKRREEVKTKMANLNPTQRRAGMGVGLLILLILPWILGTYLSEVLDNVGLFILMGLGLNIAVGLAGLLDLGYVATFAIGAYVMGLFTSTSSLGVGELNFWIVLPISILAAMTAGFLLALPVLHMRGDYLAITTLGFGEIIRILALSDWLSPIIGGAQGILAIPKPQIGSFVFRGPQEIYYLILAGCILAIFVSSRLNNSRTGRQWMAMREDEDVAAAMGIDTTKSKVLAFTLSAASGGLAGAIFASKLGTIFPHSFNLLISINVLSLIIVGGMGSLPGVVVGAFALVALPELLREFAEYRLLLYGALLIVMMLARPEGLWPSAVRRRELKGTEEEEIEGGEGAPVAVTAD